MKGGRTLVVFGLSFLLGLSLIYTGKWWPLAAAGLVAGLVATRYLHSLAALAGGALAAAVRILMYVAIGAPALAEAAAAAEVAGLPTYVLPVVSVLVAASLEAAGCLVGAFIARALRG